jgi:hypothetical protein
MKNRRKFLQGLGGITALLTMGTAARAANEPKTGGQSGNTPGPFYHVVFFWLVNDSGEVKSSFEKELRTFIKGVKEIRTSHIGRPADTDREVIDNSWSYSLILSFDSKKEQDIYQEHPLHLQFIENASSLWKKVLVYDSEKG